MIFYDEQSNKMRFLTREESIAVINNTYGTKVILKGRKYHRTCEVFHDLFESPNVVFYNTKHIKGKPLISNDADKLFVRVKEMLQFMIATNELSNNKTYLYVYSLLRTTHPTEIILWYAFLKEHPVLVASKIRKSRIQNIEEIPQEPIKSLFPLFPYIT